MTTREQHIAQKKKEIEKIERLQAQLARQALAIARKPYMRLSTLIKRGGKVVALIAQARSLEMQKQIIISRPIPKANGLAFGGPAIVGESGPEVIKIGNLTIHHNPFVNPDTIVVISECRPIDENALKSLDLAPKRWLRSEGVEQEIIIPKV